MVSSNALKRLKIVTFNMLAPCYFRYEGLVECNHPKSFLSRAQALIQPIKSENCDIICFQEYWFNRDFENVFKEEFDETHAFFTLKRPGYKEDGLAILVSKENLDVHKVEDIYFDKAGDRVGILTHISLRHNLIDSVNPLFQSFLVVNSHLTFPHSNLNRRLRFLQINALLESIDSYKMAANMEHAPVLMCGDFNDVNDPVHDRVLEEGFESVFSKVNGREAAVTHCNHNYGEVGVDFIFGHNGKPFSSSNTIEKNHINEKNSNPSKQLRLQPLECHLLPRCLPDQTPLIRPSFGHNWDEIGMTLDRPMEELVDYWGMVSDHRPLVATFDMELS